MATRADRFPSNYAKASDLGGREHTVTIASIADKEFENDGRRQVKPVITFMEPTIKPMVCNVTNYCEIETFLGADDSTWVGKKIAIYPTMANFKGRVSETIRVKRPQGNTGAVIDDAIVH